MTLSPKTYGHLNKLNLEQTKARALIRARMFNLDRLYFHFIINLEA